MNKISLILFMVFLNIVLFSCTPEVNQVDGVVSDGEEACCGNGGNIPPPPPNTGG
ncbi:hypothetical protein J1D01_03860 [Seonamhaeicola sp. NFXS20]|uniref:hypothetical protein n=1 Tax=Seonamhaeicola sp. NFXS20 TaxID=2816959 RepID=UPI003B8AA63D